MCSSFSNFSWIILSGSPSNCLKKSSKSTVILSETKEGMQQALDIFESYCEIWRLQINVAKTKMMIFRKRKTAQDPTCRTPVRQEKNSE
jgi:hypothetical protein